MFAADPTVRATCDADPLIGVLKFVVGRPYRSVAARLRVAVHSRELGISAGKFGESKVPCFKFNPTRR